MEEREIVLKRAKNAVISRDFSLAMRIYNSLLREEPENIEFLRAAGSICEKTGDDQKALEYYARIIKADNTDFNALNSIGGIYRRLKIYDKAIMILQKALSTGENNALVNYNLGFTYKLMGKYKEATDCFESVIDENPSDVLAYNHLGSIYYETNDYKKSIMTYKMGLQIDSNHPILQYNLARSYEKIGDNQNAILAYETSLRGKPGWIDAIKDYATLLLKLHKSKNALETVKKALVLYPERKDISLLEGKIYFEQYNFEQAEKALEKCITNTRGDIEVLELLSQVYEMQGRYNEAAETIISAEELVESDAAFDEVEKISEIKRLAIQILISAKLKEEAWSRLVILMDNKKSPMLFDLEGQFEIAFGNVERLGELKAKIYDVKPQFYRHFSDWGRRFLQKGNFPEAKKYFKEHIEKNRKSLTAWLFLGMADEKLGLWESAQDDYRMVLHLDSENAIAKDRLRTLDSDIEKILSIEDDNEPKGEGSEGADNGNEGASNGEKTEPSSEAETSTLAEETVPALDALPDQEENQLEEDNSDPSDYLFDEDAKSLSQQLLEGEELSDFGYEMPYEDEETSPEEEKSSDEKDSEKEEDSSGSKDGDSKEDVSDNVADSSENSDKSDTEDNLPEDNSEDKPQDQIQEEKSLPEEDTGNETDENREDEKSDAFENKEESKNTPSAEELKELSDSVEKARENAERAIKAAEKAWEAAQKAADSASAVDNAESYINQMTEDAQKKLEDVTDELKNQLEEKAEAGEKEENAESPEVEENTPSELSEEESLSAIDEIFPEPDENSQEGENLDEITPDETEDNHFQNDDETLNESELDDVLSFCQEEPEEGVCEGGELVPESEILQEGGDISSEEAAPLSANEEADGEVRYQKLLSEVSNLLPYLENLLSNKEDAEKFKTQVSLFHQLKDMGSFLPEDKRKEFMTSRVRIILDFLIAKLSGKPGLLKTSAGLIKSGVFENDDSIVKKIENNGLSNEEYQALQSFSGLQDGFENSCPEEEVSHMELTKKVIGTMKDLSGKLDDKELSIALLKLIEETEEKLQ